MRAVRAIVVAAFAVAIASIAWSRWWPGDETSIRRTLNSLVKDVNANSADGVANVARAARIGSYFTEDVVVDLGEGSAPIAGRETLMAMAVRLQPRTTAFTMKLEDVSVDVGRPPASAEVRLTAEFIRRDAASGEQSMDAKEFTLRMRKTDRTWRIARVTGLDTLK